MSLEHTEKRIDQTKTRIEKINKRIERFKRLIEKKVPEDEMWRKKWYQEDLVRAERDLKSELGLLTKYEIILEEENKKQSLIIICPAIEEFLEKWKQKTWDWYQAEIKLYKEAKKELHSYFNEHGWLDRSKEKEYREKDKWIYERFSPDIRNLADYDKDNKLLERQLNWEVDRKRLDLFQRVYKKIGKVVDASGLYVGNNLSLNGIVQGEKGNANVETIYAGGYNIQCLHYRVLIKPVK